jgi:hypothetical protein
LERGRLPPPQGETLERYARALGFKKGSGEWYTLFDMAAAEAGKIPEDLRDSALASKLPVLFRTLRDSAKDGGEDKDALLGELKRKIKDA